MLIPPLYAILHDEPKGTVLFRDPYGKFRNQEQALKRLVEDEYDVAVDVMGERHNALVVVTIMKHSEGPQLSHDGQEPFLPSGDCFATFCTSYEELAPSNLYTYTQALLNKFNYSRATNALPRFYLADHAKGFIDMSKEEFMAYTGQ